MNSTLSGKIALITGSTRGIGNAIARRIAADGGLIAVLGKSTKAGDLPGTIYSAAEEIAACGASKGARAIPIACDVRDEEQVRAAVRQTAETFGGIDIVVNNASALDLSGLDISMKKFDLIHDVNGRGSYLTTVAALPYLRQGRNPHVLTLSPPVSLDPKWLSRHFAYTLSKYEMSLMTIAFADLFKDDGIAVNSLWPETTILTAAVTRKLKDQVLASECRRVDIVSDAAYRILLRDARQCTGNFFIDADVLAEEGITDLSSYAVLAGSPLRLDLFLEGRDPVN